MNEKELIEFLKDNLTVSVGVESCCDSPTVAVRLFIKGEIISESYTDI